MPLSIILSLLALLWAGPVEAQCLGIQCPRVVLGARAGGVGVPLDGQPAPSGAYSFRRLLTAYAGNAVKLRRASDSTTLDIGFIGNNPDTASANTFCALTTCFIDTWYDQSSNTRNLVQATTSNQPAYIANCTGALPCARLTAATQSIATAANFTPATGVVTLNVVARRVGANNCLWFREDGATGNRMASGAANVWSLAPGATMTATATENFFHAAVGVINGASSLMNVDGTETTGTVVGVTTVAPASVAAAGTAACSETEVAFWDNVVLSASQRATLVTNQVAYYPR